MDILQLVCTPTNNFFLSKFKWFLSNILPMKYIFFLSLLVTLQANSQAVTKIGGEIVICGDNKLVVLQNNTSNLDSIAQIIWQWQPSQSSELPKQFQEKYLQTLDECKPINDGADFLVTSSKSAVALINRATKKASFYAHAPNAHSAELLPFNKIVVALSTAENGNAIRIYDLKQSDVILSSDYLYSAHGVVWDNKDSVLYALGYSELRAYKINNLQTNKPKLYLINTFTIPDRSGHDLQWIPNTRILLFTTEFGVHTFDVQNNEFKPYSKLEKRKDIKSISIHPITKQIMFVQAEESWWSFHIQFLEPNHQIAVPFIKVYKARWINN